MLLWGERGACRGDEVTDVFDLLETSGRQCSLPLRSLSILPIPSTTHSRSPLNTLSSTTTPLETDCAPAISILEAPHFPKNSKNLLVQDRNVRAAYRDGILLPVHVISSGFATDLNAKPSGPTDCIRKRSVLLNIKAKLSFQKCL